MTKLIQNAVYTQGIDKYEIITNKSNFNLTDARTPDGTISWSK